MNETADWEADARAVAEAIRNGGAVYIDAHGVLRVRAA